MENATKALSMAGAILITIIIVALGVQVYNSIKEMPMSEEEKLQAEEIAKFNSQFEIYNKKSLYQAEFKSVINKILNNNKLYPEYQIEIYIDDTNMTENAQVYINQDDLKNFWRCTGIEYTGGRISKMNFESVQVLEPTVDI